MKSAVALFAFVAFPMLAQPEPEECFVAKNDSVVETVSHAGRTYGFRKTGCKALFESDPERYAQLFDALAEMDAAGGTVKVEQASLVPS